MKTISRQILSIGLVAAFVLGCVLVSSGSGKWEDGERTRRADYIFMEAQRQFDTDSTGSYFELLNMAYSLDTTQTFVGHDLGFLMMLYDSNEQSSVYDRGYELMKRHFDDNPRDYYSSIAYGDLNIKLYQNNEALRVWTILDSIFPNKIDVKFKLAHVQALVGDTVNLRKAIGIYNQIEAAEGMIPQVSMRKAELYMMLNDTASMIKEARDAVAASPRSVDYHLYAAKIFTAVNQPDTALSYLNKAIEINPANGEAFLLRAETYRMMGKDSLYRQEIYTGLKQNDLDINDKIVIFQNHIRGLFNPSVYDATRRDVAEQDSIPASSKISPEEKRRIEDLFATLVDQNPHEPNVRDLYAAYLITLGDTIGAIEQTNYGLDIDPATPERWQALLTCYLGVGDYEKLVESGERARRFHPDIPWFPYIMGNASMINGDLDNAVGYLKQSLELADSADYDLLSNIYSSLGDIYNRQRDIDEYVKAYERALELNPDNILAMNNYAYALACDERDLDEAVRMSSVAADRQPTATYLDTYAWALFKKKDYMGAKEQIEKALLHDDSGSAEIFHHAGDIYFMCGDPEKALEFWRNALKLEPDNDILKRKVKHKTFFYK